MPPTIRTMTADDMDPIVELSLLAWEPVFASMRKVVGPALAERLMPDWRRDQEKGVRQICGDGDKFVALVAVIQEEVAGFLAYTLKEEEKQGETYLLAVHPGHQNQRVGEALNRAAIDAMREAGMTLAMVETGGDEGHAPARSCYENSGYTQMPIARYFQVL